VRQQTLATEGHQQCTNARQAGTTRKPHGREGKTPAHDERVINNNKNNTMKSIKTIICTLCATFVTLTFTQCIQAPQQQAPAAAPVAYNGEALRIAYVDIDTLLMNYTLWMELNEEMIRKEENIRATLNEKMKNLQTDFEEFERKLNNNAFATRERAESEQNRILKKRQELEELQERLSNELAIETNKNNILFRDSINTFVQEYNKQKGYNVILSRIGDNILYIDNDMNITQEIIDGLNARYDANKKK
jgi:outer membrane protein